MIYLKNKGVMAISVCQGEGDFIFLNRLFLISACELNFFVCPSNIQPHDFHWWVLDAPPGTRRDR